MDISPQIPDAWSPYVAWMTHAPEIPNNLMGSNLLHCGVEDLPGAREALELDGLHEEGYPPLVEAIASRYGTMPSQVSVATGTSTGSGSLPPNIFIAAKTTITRTTTTAMMV